MGISCEALRAFSLGAIMRAAANAMVSVSPAVVVGPPSRPSVQLRHDRARRGGVEAKETALRRTNGWGTETREHAQIQYLLVRLLW